MSYVGRRGVQALRNYKYSGSDNSILAKYVLQPFWSRFVYIFPLWFAPNLITLTGFFFVIASFMLSYIYCPDLSTAAPRWVYAAHGILLFLYQTFDSVDGKQARRTNSSSPLGELFDHGCDALSCTLQALVFGSTVLIGRNILWIWAIGVVPFFFATWETYFTHTLLLPEINGPDEGLFLIYMSHLFTAFVVGPTWWTLPMKEALGDFMPVNLVGDVPVNRFILYLMLIPGVGTTVITNIRNVYLTVRKKNGNVANALAMVLPFLGLVGGVTSWVLLSPSDVIATQPFLLLVGSGFIFGLLVGRMILSHLCNEADGLLLRMFLPLALLPLCVANAWSAQVLGGEPYVEELWMLIAYNVYTGALYAHFAVGVVNEITTALGIKAFRIVKKDAKP
eukprot:TRINITY_DN9703_c0_g1_i1.p1 TRINITY_DN9703_c0_g1~~TRINITY_DN9703_c0_g1_i1.p1  ORF type:complete len:393 (-),score=31.94 TRINITY_DN9703_c0_g1_i1:889-2067(-)